MVWRGLGWFSLLAIACMIHGVTAYGPLPDGPPPPPVETAAPPAPIVAPTEAMQALPPHTTAPDITISPGTVFDLVEEVLGDGSTPHNRFFYIPEDGGGRVPRGEQEQAPAPTENETVAPAQAPAPPVEPVFEETTEHIEEGPWEPPSRREETLPSPEPITGPAPPPKEVTLETFATAPPQPEGERTSFMLVGFAAAGAAALWIGLDRLRWIAARVGLATLFSRLGQKELVGSPRRQRILESVKANPGQRLSKIRDIVGLPNGALFHHLLLLESSGLLRLERRGNATWVFPQGSPSVVVDENPNRRRILDFVVRTPGATQRQIVEATGLSKRIVGYHVGWLNGNQLVRVERRGRSTYCNPTGPTVRPPAEGNTGAPGK